MSHSPPLIATAKAGAGRGEERVKSPSWEKAQPFLALPIRGKET